MDISEKLLLRLARLVVAINKVEQEAAETTLQDFTHSSLSWAIIDMTKALCLALEGE